MFRFIDTEKLLNILERHAGYIYDTDLFKDIENITFFSLIKEEYIYYWENLKIIIKKALNTFISFVIDSTILIAAFIIVPVKIIIYPFIALYNYLKIVNLKSSPKFKEIKKRHFECIERLSNK